ncbi:hypothetical protein Btru_030098 [Bulinus truncatus]|nr:hypothetical protein Btru_030098 [Bulinus truncatus]
MATNGDCQNVKDTKNWKLWHELLPGIEEFFVNTLASETLSSFAEERRQFFIECLDIIKLPPTVPPREGRKLSPDLLKATEETSGIPTDHLAPDFAATQREISRSFVEPVTNPYQDDPTDEDDENSSEKGTKVYDDIDPTDSVKDVDATTQPNNSDGDDDNDENDLYEIPVARLQLSSEENSLSCGTEGLNVATIGCVEDFSEDVVDACAPPLPLSPPPLPPRKDMKFSEFGSRNSLNLEEKPPELPFRPPLAKRNELYVTRSDRSGERSDQDISGDGDSTSYESFDEAVDPQDQEFRAKNNIKLPKKPKKKSGLRKNKKLSKSRSSSQWEISAPFRKLENILISGELYYRGKLSWNRRIVAISNGSLAMYKPDKDARPSLVISLSGYEATVLEREGRRGFEVKMSHPTQDSHTFSVDFRDWANLWRDHINGVAKGQPLVKYETHLARSFSAGSDYGTTGHMGSKSSETSKILDDLDYDEIGPCEPDLEDLFIEEKEDSESTCNSSNPSHSGSEKQLRSKMLSRHFRSEKSSLFKNRTMDSSRSGPFTRSYKEKNIGATVKDILRRRQKGMYQVQGSQLSDKNLQVAPNTVLTGIQCRQNNQDQPVNHPGKSRTATMPSVGPLSMARWDWKSVFYNWSLPLDQIILALRGSDLTSSNSNLSTGSEGTSEESSKPRIQGNKVMRMGSFAFRATQFFENIGKKSSKPRKSTNSVASGDYSDLHNGIVEESSVSSSASTGNLSPSGLTPTSDLSMPNVFSDSYSSSAPNTPLSPVSLSLFGKGFDECQEFFPNVDHKELLPGIEEFFVNTLASETLSSFAEERRQFFIECLDIIKLPPTVPPREGRKLSPDLLKATEETSGIPTDHLAPDFAATQREISRSFVEPVTNPYQDDPTDEDDENSSEKGTKVYDDIDPTDSVKDVDATTQPNNSDDVDDNDNDLYEIPVARLQLSSEENSLSCGAEGLNVTTIGSVEDFSEDVVDASAPPLPLSPPPLPPRKDMKFSEFGSRNSLNLEEKPPELPFRPPLAKRNELYVTRSDRSGERSDPDISGDGDSTSYESFDEAVDPQDQEFRAKNNIKLPKKPKKKSGLRKNKKLSKSRSSSQWEISAPFRKLENILISGELYYRGKLSWNRRIVAISNGSLAMYKPDKDARPSLVISLSGYEATVLEREGRRGFEVKMSHPNQDSHTFSVDFRDWANLWRDHINGVAKGQPLAKYETHLARSFSAGSDYGTTGHMGSKSSETSKNLDDLDYDEIGPCEPDLEDLFIEEKEDSESTCNSSNPSHSGSEKQLRSKMLSRHFRSEKSSLFKNRTMDSSRSGPFTRSYKEKNIGTTVKDILRRRQKGMYQVQGSQLSDKNLQVAPNTVLTGIQCRQNNQDQPVNHPGKSRTATLPSVGPLSMARWDWKSVFYNWSLPLDQIILALRGSDLTSSNSNLSTGSEGTSEESSKPRIRGNKVMRMGSFAFRATQFFENIGKKSSKPRKSTNSVASGDYSDLHNGIVEESSVSSSASTGNLSPSGLTPTSDLSMPNVFSDNYSSSAPNTPLSPVSLSLFGKGFDECQEFFPNVDHKGYLFIFSTFNRRKWGKRWCLVRENMFECYRTEQSRQCELNFLLRHCTVRRATSETNSELGLMILESGKEKITVEPLSKEEMSSWVQILLAETSTVEVPIGLEEYVKAKDGKDGDSNSVMSFTVLKNWDMMPHQDMTLSHEYEDPLDTTLTASHFYAACCADPSYNEGLSENSSTGQLGAPDNDTLDTKLSDVSDSTSSCNKSKHATDSGFYSVKGNNSDSDSGCENITREAGELDCGYAMLDSHSYRTAQQLSAANTNNSSDHLTNISVQNSDVNQYESVLPNEVSQNTDPCVHSSSSAIVHSTSTKNQTSRTIISSASNDINSTDSSHVKSNSPSLPSHLSFSSHETSVATTATILSPSGDEYSIVIKRSSKSKSKSPEPNSSTRKDLQLCSVSQDIDHEQNLLCDDRLLNNANEPPILPYSPVPELERSILTDDILPSPNNSPSISDSSPEKDVKPKTSGLTSPSGEKKSGQCNQSITNRTPPQPAQRTVNRVSPIKVTPADSSPAFQNNNNSIPSPSSNSLSRNHSPLIGDSPITPKTENITYMIDNPATTPDDIKTAVERLKIKHSKLKKKRMAVHEKRQKVQSDEERLVCEKELAALEKDIKNTDLDIRVLQNHLDTLQGQSLEAIKVAHRAHKSIAKKKKNKRKS